MKALLGICLLVMTSQSLFGADPAQYRGLWVDAWHSGFKSQPEIERLVRDARAANFNSIYAQVRRRGDAFYHSTLVPRSADTNVVPADFDCLKALLEAAHDTSKGPRLEVHAWLVMYPVTGYTRPSDPVHVFNAQPDWLSQTDLGTQFDGVERGFWLDPGHPKVQAHLFEVVMDVATRYDIDGVCFDYLRYPGTEWGYNPAVVERFNQLHGRKGVPGRGDAEWTDFRRNQVTALLRKIYLTLAEARPMLNVSAVGMTFSPAITPTTGWTNTGTYVRSLQDWRAWAEEGIVDTSIPLVFFKTDTPARQELFSNWTTFAKENAHGRHLAISTANYNNSLPEGLRQLQSCMAPNSSGNHPDGVLFYSYYKPAAEKIPWSEVARALTQASGQQIPPFRNPVATPSRTWRIEPRSGHLKGFVRAQGSEALLDGATVGLTGPEERATVTDATGFYGFIDLKPGEYALIFEANGFSSLTNRVAIIAGKPARLDPRLTKEQ